MVRRKCDVQSRKPVGSKSCADGQKTMDTNQQRLTDDVSIRLSVFFLLCLSVCPFVSFLSNERTERTQHKTDKTDPSESVVSVKLRPTDTHTYTCGSILDVVSDGSWRTFYHWRVLCARVQWPVATMSCMLYVCNVVWCMFSMYVCLS